MKDTEDIDVAIVPHQIRNAVMLIEQNPDVPC
jgi:hypothetical protein